METQNFGRITIHTAGTTFENRQGKLWNIRKNNAQGIPSTTMLRREPNNKYDPNAIAVLVESNGTVAKVGYVPANNAVWLAKLMDEGRIVRAYHGSIIGGTAYKQTMGWLVDIAYAIA